MHAVVMFEPRNELAQHAGRIGLRTDPRVIPFESFDEGFSHAVGLGALDWRRAGQEADVSRQGAGVPGGVGRAVVREPLDRLGQFVDKPEAALDAFVIRSRMSELSMPPVVATQEIASRSQQSSVKAMRTSRRSRGQSRARPSTTAWRDAAIMPAFLAAPPIALQQRTVRLHDSRCGQMGWFGVPA